MTEIVLPSGKGETRERQLINFANQLQKIQEQIGFKISSRGWCYQLEGFGLISKAEFGRIEGLINECRALGYVPIDFTAEEEGRRFSGVEIPNDGTPAEYISRFASAMERCQYGYTPDWLLDPRFEESDQEGYYIQMLVEKIDLVSLFKPVVERYKIPIATSKGWSSMLQRAEYARRFKIAEERGLKCVLLYCGDHDPDGLRISQKIKKNLNDLKDIVWENGDGGYDPTDLIVDRFGLNYQFILANNLTWIDNSEDVPPIGIPKLITGSGKNLADPNHKHFHMTYMQDYIKNYGVRKCEANALVVRPEQGRDLCRSAIERYLGSDAINRFKCKEEVRNGWFDDVRSTIKVGNLNLAEVVKAIQKGLSEFDENKEKEENNG